MSVQSVCGLTALSLLFLLADVRAEEENFGKATPSQEKIIEHFKMGAEESSEADSGSDQNAPSGNLNGIKTRGLNIIKTGKTAPAHKPLSHALEEKAISMEILFDYNSATLTAEARKQLGPLGGALVSDDLKGMRFRIEGHTDIVGGDQFNIDLSRRRAEAVKGFLTEQYGLAADSIQVEGKGKSDLADKNDPTSEVNRRVRIVRLIKN